MQDALQKLIDQRSLDELICAQAIAADTLDWTALRKCLADEIDFILSEKMGHTTDPDEFVANAKVLLPGFDSVMHTVTNIRHEIVGDEAHSDAYVEAKHFLKNDVCPEELTGGGVYIFTSIRTDAGWRLKKMRLRHIYLRGDPRLYEVAMERVREGKRAAG
jgi:hypothetical protein